MADDAQDPLPESSFLYRRITVWVVGIVILALLWFNVYALRQLEHGDGLVTISQWLIGLLALLLTYYLIAPSAEHIVRMFQMKDILKSGTATQAISTVTTAAGKITEKKITTGPPQQPASTEPPEETPWRK